MDNKGKLIKVDSSRAKENARGIWDRWPDYTEVATQTGGALFPQTSSADDTERLTR